MRILAIDPGTDESGWVIWDTEVEELDDFGIDDNNDLINSVREKTGSPDILILEMIYSYGMPVGLSVFNTILWIGRFLEAWKDPTVELIPRREVKLNLCGSPRAKDSNIRTVLIDRYGPVGKKKTPGPLYGVKSHIWSALAIAVTYQDILKEEKTINRMKGINFN